MVSRKRIRVRALGAAALTCSLAVGCARHRAAPAPEPEAAEPRTEVAPPGNSVTRESVRGQKVVRVEEMLEGRVPGLEVLRRSDGSFSLRIRGTGSFIGGKEPLYVIDGQELPVGLRDPLGGLMPQDIERIDVLKDAGSTAIYGVRGMNGVIVIQTRQH